MPEIKEKFEEDKPRGQKRLKSFPSKVIIRKLPPSLTQEAFIEAISPLPDLHDLYFVKADWTLGAEATSRAYLEFQHEEDIFIFRDKFDSYIFVDSVRGSEYPAVVEYASFQGLPKSRARKKDKHVSTIEIEQHFLTFLEQLKAEEDESQKFEPKVSVEYSYQLKDDKKITSTPLIEFLSQKKEEKRDARINSQKKKQDDKRKQRDDDKQKKRVQVAKNVPEAIKEVKEDTVYEDGIMVRTVPSRLGRGDRSDRKKDSKSEGKLKSDEPSEKELERREKRDKEKDARIKKHKEKREKRRSERSQQRAKDYEKKTFGAEGEKPSTSMSVKEAGDNTKEPRGSREPLEPDGREPREPKDGGREPKEKKENFAKPETKRYSALRKARQEKTSDVKDPSESQENQDEAPSAEPKAEVDKKAETSHKRAEWDEAKKIAREKRAEENRERRAREADERAQRQIKNKDRPTLQIYQPKRRQDNEPRGDNTKSSDENSEASRIKSDSDRRGDQGSRRERRGDRNPSRKTSRDETGRHKKSSRKNSDETAAVTVDGGKEAAAGLDFNKVKDEVLSEKLEKLALDSPKKSPETVEPKESGDAE